MHKLNDDIKQYYIDDPEALETRRIMLWEYLEERIKYFNLDHLNPPAFNKLEKMWELATSYWIFPDLADIDKMLDEVFKENQV